MNYAVDRQMKPEHETNVFVLKPEGAVDCYDSATL
jgi:hypothetical protein